MSGGPSDVVKRQVLWMAVGLLAYLGAGLLLLLAVMPALTDDGLDMGAVGPEHAGAMFASLLLFVLGGHAARRLRRVRSRAHADTRSLPNEYQASVRQQVEQEKTSSDAEEDTRQMVKCEQCGTLNEQFYTYCGECSAKL